MERQKESKSIFAEIKLKKKKKKKKHNNIKILSDNLKIDRVITKNAD